MKQPSSGLSKCLRSLTQHLPQGSEFWLPLPIIGVLFWGLGGWLTDYQLKNQHRPVENFAIGQPQTDNPSILTGRAIIRRDRITEIEVVVLEPVPRLLIFYWPLTEPAAIETALATYFNQSPSEVQSWLRFEVLP